LLQAEKKLSCEPVPLRAKLEKNEKQKTVQKYKYMHNSKTVVTQQNKD